MPVHGFSRFLLGPCVVQGAEQRTLNFDLINPKSILHKVNSQMALQTATKCPYTGEHTEQTHSNSLCNPCVCRQDSHGIPGFPGGLQPGDTTPEHRNKKVQQVPTLSGLLSGLCLHLQGKHSVSSSTSSFAFPEPRMMKAGRSDQEKRPSAEALLCLYTSPLGCGVQVRGSELPARAGLRVSHPEHYSEPQHMSLCHHSGSAQCQREEPFSPLQDSSALSSPHMNTVALHDPKEANSP